MWGCRAYKWQSHIFKLLLEIERQPRQLLLFDKLALNMNNVTIFINVCDDFNIVNQQGVTTCLIARQARCFKSINDVYQSSNHTQFCARTLLFDATVCYNCFLFFKLKPFKYYKYIMIIMIKYKTSHWNINTSI